MGAVDHSDKNGWSHGDKGFDVAQSHFERLGFAADIFQSFERRDLPSVQTARGEDGHVSGQMGQIGMQLLPEVLHKFPDSIPHISHQGITGILHVNPKLYPRKRAQGLELIGNGQL